MMKWTAESNNAVVAVAWCTAHRGLLSVFVESVGCVEQIPRPMPFTPQTPSNQPMSRRRADSEDNELMVTLLTTFSSLYSGTTVSMLAIAGLVSSSPLTLTSANTAHSTHCSSLGAYIASVYKLGRLSLASLRGGCYTEYQQETGCGSTTCFMLVLGFATTQDSVDLTGLLIY